MENHGNHGNHGKISGNPRLEKRELNRGCLGIQIGTVSMDE